MPAAPGPAQYRPLHRSRYAGRRSDFAGAATGADAAGNLDADFDANPIAGSDGYRDAADDANTCPNAAGAGDAGGHGDGGAYSNSHGHPDGHAGPNRDRDTRWLEL